MKEGNVVAWSGHATYDNYLRSTRYRCSETLGAYSKDLQGTPRYSKVLQGLGDYLLSPRTSETIYSTYAI